MKPPIIHRYIRIALQNMAAVFLFVALACHSEPLKSNNSSENTPLQKEIAKIFPKFEAHSATESDDYAAAILTMPITEDDEHEMKVALFHRNTDQSYRLISSSKSWKVYLLDRVGWSIKTDNKALLLSLGGSTGCCSGFETTYRFRIEELAIRLAGEETTSYGYEDSNSDNFYETRASINYLSGKVIHSRRSGTRKANPNELGFDGKTNRVEIQLSFPNKYVWKLSNFNPDQYANYQMQIPELCGGINETMKYKPCELEKKS